ncbi:MAG: 3-hydroxyacyl-ACP dehydratase FabZ [SAR324 cluster bacterium]|nr:3-hydroxyacyl-ACP dehydratase FabZ [SAR324 cluster bacterium]
MMDIQEILEYLPHRYPFLLVDRVTELTETRAVGVKCVTINEYFFRGHFPGHPVMPGVLIVEAMAQTCGMLAYSTEPNPADKSLLFAGIDKARFKSLVIPGDQLIIDVEIVNRRLNLVVFRAFARVDGKVVSQGELRMALIDNE